MEKKYTQLSPIGGSVTQCATLALCHTHLAASAALRVWISSGKLHLHDTHAHTHTLSSRPLCTGQMFQTQEGFF